MTLMMWQDAKVRNSYDVASSGHFLGPNDRPDLGAPIVDDGAVVLSAAPHDDATFSVTNPCVTPHVNSLPSLANVTFILKMNLSVFA